MHQTGPTWLVVLASVSLAIALLCAAAILLDILVMGRRQGMAIMNWVWPATALYWGPVAAWLYLRRGRQGRGPAGNEARSTPGGADLAAPAGAGAARAGGAGAAGIWSFARAHWWSISLGVSHCGAGCTLGDITGEWIVYAAALTVGGLSLAANELIAMLILDFIFAWSYGIAFQYFSIVPMRRDLAGLPGIWAAIRADTLSIVCFQVGLFGFMAIFHLVIFKPPLSIGSPVYWLMMQIGMVIGYITAWPVNAWLIGRGWKEGM